MDCSRPRTKDPGEWLETCPDFSQPMAEQVVEWFLTWEPDLVESIKWNMLCFSGRKLVVGLSACRAHLGIAFFRGTELPDPAGLFTPGSAGSTNIRSIRMTSLAGFNLIGLRKLLRSAVLLDEDPTIPPAPKIKRAPLPLPAYFAQALAQSRNRIAAQCFRSLAPSCQREYVAWLAAAKLPETQSRRLNETLAALAARRKWAQRKLVNQPPLRPPSR